MRALQPGRLGSVELSNRIIRAATSESMGGPRGEITPQAVEFYRKLGAGGAGLIMTGHLFVHPRGRHNAVQFGIDSDGLIDGHARLTEAVHREGGKIFAELAHAGSQTAMRGIEPLAPSPVVNPMTGVAAAEMTEADIEDVVEAFGTAAWRAKTAGYDGIHFAGANGYLFSQFMSPYSNKRDDAWGGDAHRRGRFPMAVIGRIRAAIGKDFAFTGRLGAADNVEGGMTLSEGLDRLEAIDIAGELDGIEPALNIIHDYEENIRPYVGVGPRRAAQDWLFHRIFSRGYPEAYFRSLARSVKQRVRMPVILMGGIRSTEIMEEILASGDADFLALSRPFIREPDIARQIVNGRRGKVACVSCNACLMHDGMDPLQCWRTPKWRLAQHFYDVLWRDRARSA
ncbi:MAG: NADH:flavin oxidoreductase [Pseudomonadota bacterium]